MSTEAWKEAFAVGSVGGYVELLHLYCDGGLVGSPPSPAGTWAWCAVDSEGGRTLEASGVVVPKRSAVVAPEGQPTFSAPAQVVAKRCVTNNQTELIAAILALEAMPEGWSGILYSDSAITLGRLFLDWAWRKGVTPKMRERASNALARLGPVKPQLLQGHPSRAQLQSGYGSKQNDMPHLVPLGIEVGQLFPVSIHNVWCDAQCRKEAEKWRLQQEAV